jgi:geranylgeranyl pyrophosphate synthase
MPKAKSLHPETKKEPTEKIKAILKKEGMDGWNLAKETLQTTKTHNATLKEALEYLELIPDFFRPAVVSFCCKAVGGSSENTIPTSAALVLFAKAIGIHDDIIDNVKKRKNHVTAFGKFGKEIALVLSDILLFKGFKLLQRNLEIGISPIAFGRIFETIDGVWFEQSESEVMEQQARRDIIVSPQECLTKIKKRASEFEVITRIGGILGGGTENEVESLARYGRLTGTASLLRNELIDMLEFDVLKHRIMNESLPLPIIYAAQNAEKCSELLSLISSKRLTTKNLRRISLITDELGGMSHVASNIKKMDDEACSSISVFRNVSELMFISRSLQIEIKDWRQVLESK